MEITINEGYLWIAVGLSACLWLVWFINRAYEENRGEIDIIRCTLPFKNLDEEEWFIYNGLSLQKKDDKAYIHGMKEWPVKMDRRAIVRTRRKRKRVEGK